MSVPRVTVLILSLGLAACGGRGEDVTLTNIKHTGEGPDEFTVLPTRPLQTPESYSALPAPAPGSANLVDTNPKAEGVAALGGNPAALTGTAPAAADSGLVRNAGRYGAQPGIRQTLAREDAETRRKHGRVNILRLGPVDDYTNAYKRQWLDADSEEMRMRRAGVETPSAPPPSD